MFSDLLSAELFATFLVFARIGAAFITLPSIGETFLNPRARLAVALMLSVVAAPVVSPLLPDMPERLGDLALLLLGEIVHGIFIGTVTRVLFNALAIAGVIWSFLSGLASALLFNPLLADQGALQSIFFTLLGLMLIFATDMHHLLIRTVVESYVIFEPGQAPMLGDMADVVARTVADSFKLGIQLVAPLIVVALMFYTLLGLLARLMPQLQVFFIAMPLQILIGMVVMFITIGGMMLWFLEQYREMLGMFLTSF
ncbi:flagellar biosynthetic protein FliR [Marivibrio halodurans]|uniref:Flagellar biosynthetic protein FliR n=1 Tax=Marivibrio halodurans TaxID=2039722 RepID=A0A8J7V253_9PROT|nr:flagellar biosynthetic protein FliR [Marivibrio halodurans]MBP5857010.1 flagellar biosynthetic protein FliR [Marivibrio halodurans]